MAECSDGSDESPGLCNTSFDCSATGRVGDCEACTGEEGQAQEGVKGGVRGQWEDVVLDRPALERDCPPGRSVTAR